MVDTTAQYEPFVLHCLSCIQKQQVILSHLHHTIVHMGEYEVLSARNAAHMGEYEVLSARNAARLSTSYSPICIIVWYAAFEYFVLSHMYYCVVVHV